MSDKTKRVISIVLMVLPSLMILMSGIMKLAGSEQVVQALTKAGLGSYALLFGIIELASVALFLYPKTYKLGFLLLCCYLGGALSIELAGGQAPTAAVLLTVLWISVYLRDKFLFLIPARVESK
jgi:hypothetical protein